MDKKHEFTVTVCGQTAATVKHSVRKEALNAAVRLATEYADAGFPNVEIAGVSKEDFDSVEAVEGYPKTVVQ